MKTASLCGAAVVLALSILGASARAQCPQWTHGFEGTDLANYGRAAVVHDDGSGRSLFVGGGFTAAGDAFALNVARWDGSAWHAVGGGTNGLVYDLAVFDEGAGPVLFATGNFTQAEGLPVNGIARWNGTSWSAVGSGLFPMGGQQSGGQCLKVFDDGTGPALYVGGNFASAGGVSAPGIARWDGTTWSSLAGGVTITPSGNPGVVAALTIFDSGSGPELVAGGSFNLAGGLLVDNLARWNGSSWSGFGTGLNSNTVYELATYDEGSGPRLFAGGTFSSVNGVNTGGMARWDGSSWSALPGMFPNGSVQALFVHDDGSGAALWVAGSYVLGGPSYANFARWNGTTWTPITDAPSSMFGAATFDEGQGPNLFIVGYGGVTGGAARWDGSTWSVLRPGGGITMTVNTAASIQEAGGAALYVGTGGPYGNSTTRTTLRWDGSSWSYVDGLTRPVGTLEVIGQGAAARLYAGVSILNSGPALWRLENGAWIPVGGNFFANGDTYIDAIAEFDDGSGPAIYVGGRFSSAGGFPVARIAKWDGSVWSPVGSGVSDSVHALKVWDDGTGPALYAGGFFDHAGSLPANRIAKWNGTSWSALGTGINTPLSRVFALEVWNDGNGPALYAGGNFAQAGGNPANYIARWSGSAWSGVGGGLTSPYPYDSRVRALHAHDDGSGSGSALYVGGLFTLAGGVPVQSLARWNGTNWSALGNLPATPQTNLVRALATHADGSGAGPALFAGGTFFVQGDVPALNVARWTGCGSVGESLCVGDGSGSACPCGNTSAPGEERGCRHALGQGARLRANGVPSLSNDTLVLRGDDMTPTSTCLYFQGLLALNGGAGVAFGDGLRCAAGTVVRLGVRTNAMGASTWPGAGDPQLSSHVVAPGNTRIYQIWYRDASTYCTPSTFNWTNGLRVVWSE